MYITKGNMRVSNEVFRGGVSGMVLSKVGADEKGWRALSCWMKINNGSGLGRSQVARPARLKPT
jgi:hypothetical protein